MPNWTRARGGAERLRRSQRARQEQSLEAIAMLGNREIVSHVARSRRRCERLRSRRTSRRSALHAGRVELACAIERSSRRNAQDATRSTASSVRYAGYLGQHARRDVRTGRFALGKRHAQRAPGLFEQRACPKSEPRYYHELARYRKAVQQKNALLRGHDRSRSGAAGDVQPHASRGGNTKSCWRATG